MKIVYFILITLLLACFTLTSCGNESRDDIFREELNTIAHQTAPPIYYSPVSGSLVKQVTNITIFIRYNTNTGDIYGLGYGYLSNGGYNSSDTNVKLYYLDNIQIKPYMLEHPENFHWVIN